MARESLISASTTIDEHPTLKVAPGFGKTFPWIVSLMFHLSMASAVVVVLFVASHALQHDDDEQIVIPTSFTDPGLSSTLGPMAPGNGGDPSKDAAQEHLKEVLKADGWAQSESTQNIAGLLEGQTAQTDIDFIASGNGGHVGSGATGPGDSGGGALSPYGSPGGVGGAGFKSSFYGTGGSASRIVYIIDHSGSMLDNFDYLKQETKRSVNNLVPLQFFNVIMVSDTASIVGTAQVKRATADAKREFISTLEDYVAEGQNDDLLPPFQEAFQKAFAMKPQLIYFLTDGHFDPRLMDVVQRLNADKKVHINTLAFVNHDPSYESQLQDLAKNNGGVYKFISDKDAQGR